MDFRMEKSSYALLTFIFATCMYYGLSGAGWKLPFIGYLQMIGFILLLMIALIALCSIPVLIYCYIVKKIPDIDYSIIVAAGVTFVGIISELF